MINENYYSDDSISNIRDRITGRLITATVSRAKENDVRRLFRKDGWRFSWKQERKKPDRQIYKLLIDGCQEIQGLISLEPKIPEKFIELHLIESAPHNFGSRKRFTGVATSLVAFACKMSFEIGLEGYAVFTAKTRLVQHYIDTLGACVINRNNRMAITTGKAKELVNSCYKNFNYDL